MKLNIGNILRRLFYKFGIYIKYIPNIDHLYNYLHGKDDAHKFYELKYICYVVALSNDNNFYNQIIKRYVPDWDIEARASTFIGEGSGVYNLNTYRKLELYNNNTLFEKTYLTKSLDYEKIIFIKDNILNLLDDKIKTPQIKFKYTSDFITVIYYEYLDLAPFSSENINEYFVEITKFLYKKSTESKVESMITKAPEILKDYSLFHDYMRFEEEAKDFLHQLSIDYNCIEKKINKARKVITHGDIKRENFYEGDYLIDWDHFGLYPIGLEVALVCSKLIIYKLLEETPLNWLYTNYKSMLDENEWELFELSFSYFLFIFSYRHIHKAEFSKFKSELIETFKTNEQ